MEAANAAVPRITPAQAREMIAKGNTLVVDVRDAPDPRAYGQALTVRQSGTVGQPGDYPFGKLAPPGGCNSTGAGAVMLFVCSSKAAKRRTAMFQGHRPQWHRARLSLPGEPDTPRRTTEHEFAYSPHDGD
jgi:hypothetical protein